MLRISVEDSPERITVRLDGKVSGPWVNEVARTWDAVRARPERKPVSLDLRHVSFLDEAGTRLISAMGRQGVETVWDGPWLRSALFTDGAKLGKAHARRGRKQRQASLTGGFAPEMDASPAQPEKDRVAGGSSTFEETSPQKPFAV